MADIMRDNGFEIPDENIANIGVAIGAHIGKNTCGFVYVSK